MLENKQHKQHSMALFELIHYQLALNFAQQEPAEQVSIGPQLLGLGSASLRATKRVGTGPRLGC